jgi:hypothetical protein
MKSSNFPERDFGPVNNWICNLAKQVPMLSAATACENVNATVDVPL